MSKLQAAPMAHSETAVHQRFRAMSPASLSYCSMFTIALQSFSLAGLKFSKRPNAA